jgi:hypothetical protein
MIDRVTGDVFHYPYLWLSDHERGIDNPKNRTTCLVLKTKDPPGITHLVILAISDRLPDNPEDAIEAPQIEVQRGGLNPARRAFVNISEYNVDALPFSHHYDPNSPTFGRFSRSFAELLARSLAAKIRGGKARRLSRR